MLWPKLKTMTLEEIREEGKQFTSPRWKESAETEHHPSGTNVSSRNPKRWFEVKELDLVEAPSTWNPRS